MKSMHINSLKLNQNKRKNLSRHLMKGLRIFLGILILLSAVLPYTIPVKADAAPDNPIIIVLDAGHGGKSVGANYFDLKEKDLNLSVAKSIKHYLECFDNIKVYMTRKDDKDSSFTNRAKYAKAKKADYFISIHFNESEQHKQTGSEIYVSANEESQKAIMPLAQSAADYLQEMGIYNAGIYTCVDSEGKDYFGQIRACEENGEIPSMILEHLFMDREEYVHFIDTPEALDAIGKSDALAIARALHLNANSMIYKFEGTPEIEYDKPFETKDVSVYPENASISIKEYEQITNRACVVTFSISSSGGNSVMEGYRVSQDGGATYGDILKFDNGTNGEFTTIVRRGVEQIIVVSAFNKEHLNVTSNMIDTLSEVELDPAFTQHQKEALEAQKAEEEQAMAEGSSENPSEPSIGGSEPTPEANPSESDSSHIHDHDPKISDNQIVVVLFGAFMGLVICLLLFFMQKSENSK